MCCFLLLVVIRKKNEFDYENTDDKLFTLIYPNSLIAVDRVNTHFKVQERVRERKRERERDSI